MEQQHQKDTHSNMYLCVAMHTSVCLCVLAVKTNLWDNETKSKHIIEKLSAVTSLIQINEYATATY